MAADPLDSAYARSVAPYLAAVTTMAHEEIRAQLYRLGGIPVPRVGAVGQATAGLGRTISQTQALADMLGRRSALVAAKGVATRSGHGIPPRGPVSVAGAMGAPLGGPGLARVPFLEAVGDLIAREPMLARTAGDVAAAYSESHGFALARAAHVETTKRVQSAIARAVHVGTDAPTLVANIERIAREVGEDMADWTRAYAETVARTNMSTAFSAGRFRQVAEPEVSAVIGAFRYTAVGDSDTRPNHRAYDGMIAAPNDPVWHTAAPPQGYRCRCTLEFVDWLELQRKGLVLPSGQVRPARVPFGAHPDSGFSRTARPDITIYGGTA